MVGSSSIIVKSVLHYIAVIINKVILSLDISLTYAVIDLQIQNHPIVSIWQCIAYFVRQIYSQQLISVKSRCPFWDLNSIIMDCSLTTFSKLFLGAGGDFYSYWTESFNLKVTLMELTSLLS